jgi:hypothetical protein
LRELASQKTMSAFDISANTSQAKKSPRTSLCKEQGEIMTLITQSKWVGLNL